jgi:hypothetical protein
VFTPSRLGASWAPPGGAAPMLAQSPDASPRTISARKPNPKRASSPNLIRPLRAGNRRVGSRSRIQKIASGGWSRRATDATCHPSRGARGRRLTQAVRCAMHVHHMCCAVVCVCAAQRPTAGSSWDLIGRGLAYSISDERPSHVGGGVHLYLCLCANVCCDVRVWLLVCGVPDADCGRRKTSSRHLRPLGSS